MRLSYLALDRFELQYAAKELARAMQEPAASDFDALKRAARFLLSFPRTVQDFPRQLEVPTKITCFSDSDHAGCLKTRRSSSSVKVFYGRHLLRSSSTTQTVVALSSGESEFYAAVRAASTGIGAVSMLRDLGRDLENPVEVKVKHQDNPCLEIRADASAGIGIASRRGAGRVRHIATPTLWLQKLIQDKKAAIVKVPGDKNCADMGTKHLDASTMRRHMAACSYRFLDGQSALALKASVLGHCFIPDSVLLRVTLRALDLFWAGDLRHAEQRTSVDPETPRCERGIRMYCLLGTQVRWRSFDSEGVLGEMRQVAAPPAGATRQAAAPQRYEGT